LNRINFFFEPSVCSHLSLPFRLPSTFNKVNFPLREAAIFSATCSFSAREKSDKTVGYREETEMEKKKWKEGREEEGRDGDRVEYELHVVFVEYSILALGFHTRLGALSLILWSRG